MARFYRTSLTPQEDYTLDPRLYKGLTDMGALGTRTTKKSDKTKVGQSDVGVIPDDIPAYTQVRQEYEQEINSLVSKLRQNPQAYKTLEPEIANLRSRMAADNAPGGRLYAFNYRAKQWDQMLDNLSKSMKDDPDMLEYAKSQINTGKTYRDETTGAPVDISSTFVRPWSQKESAAFVNSVKSQVRPVILRELETLGLKVPGFDLKDIGAIVSETGYPMDKVRGAVENMLTASPEIIRRMYSGFEYEKYKGIRPADEKFEDFVENFVVETTNALTGTQAVQRTTVQEDSPYGAALKAQRAKSAGGAAELSLENFSPFIGYMVQTVQSPQIQQAIAQNKNEFIPIPEMAQQLGRGLGTYFGTDNVIKTIAYNPSTDKFYYKALIDIWGDGGQLSPAEQNKWRELTTTVLGQIGAITHGAKWGQGSYIEALKNYGIIDENQQLTFKKYRRGRATSTAPTPPPAPAPTNTPAPSTSTRSSTRTTPPASNDPLLNLPGGR